MPSFRPVPLAVALALALAFSGPSHAADPAASAAAPPSILPDPVPLTTDAQALARTGQRDDLVRDARDALVHHDRARLAADRNALVAARHPLAVWVDYWDLVSRIVEVGSDEIQAFYARWPNTYQEDRLRNDWLLETGRRRDWAAFGRDFPRFRMNDDRQVACYALVADHLAGKDVREAARAAWLAQKDTDEGCQLLAQTLYDDKVFTEDDIWARLRQTAEFGRQRAARAAAQIVGKALLKDVNDLWDNPARYLARRADGGTTRREKLLALALVRMGASDPGAAALQMTERGQSALGAEDTAWAWAILAKQGAQSLLPDAADWQQRAWAAYKPRKADERPDWGDDALAWHARAALRAGTGTQRWRDMLRAIDAMSPAERTDPTWIYWRAKAQLALAKERKEAAEAEPLRGEATAALNGIAGGLGFYGLLAAEDLGVAVPLPTRSAPVTPAERGIARASPGLQRALAMIALDLRPEGIREWNYTLRGMGDRELVAAAQWACEQSDWQVCINTSERTKGEVDVATRYPTPFRREITQAAKDAGLEPAFLFGIIRQETRFMPGLRSHVGATGLMQLMPATARWVAKKGAFDYRPELIADPATNLQLGSFYLKMVLDNFGGSPPMAAAAYNAGPARPRRWRGGLMLDPAVWTENVPFLETRDYVKKVTANTAIYAALLSGKTVQLRQRLGPRIGPQDAEKTDQEIPTP